MNMYIVHFKKGHNIRFIQGTKYLVRCDDKWNALNQTGWTIDALKRAESVARIERPIQEALQKLGDDLVQ